MNRKQLTLVVVTAAIIAGVLAGSVALEDGDGGDDGGRLSVVASFYPLGYLAEEIGGERVSVRVMVPENTELHGWTPSPSDILAAEDAEVLLYNGAGLDHWFEEDILGSISVEDAVVVETTEGLELLGKDQGEDHDHEHGETDPHTWLSPHMALGQARAVYEGLVEADPDGKAAYTAAWADLRQRLETLDASYLESLNGTEHDVLVVAHSAYGYIAHRYGLEQHGVIGLSADEQPSTAALSELADLMAEEGVGTVFVDPVYSDEYARTLEKEVERQTGEDVRVLSLHLMNGRRDGLDYLEQMEANLGSLVDGLGSKGQGG